MPTGPPRGEGQVRSPRFEVLRRLHFIQTTRVHQTRSWLVSFSISGRFRALPTHWLICAQVGSCRVREAGRAAGAARDSASAGPRRLLLPRRWDGLRYRRSRDSIARLRSFVRSRRVRNDRVGGRLGRAPRRVAAAAACGRFAGGASRGAGWWCRELTLYCVC